MPQFSFWLEHRPSTLHLHTLLEQNLKIRIYLFNLLIDCLQSSDVDPYVSVDYSCLNFYIKDTVVENTILKVRVIIKLLATMTHSFN